MHHSKLSRDKNQSFDFKLPFRKTTKLGTNSELPVITAKEGKSSQENWHGTALLLCRRSHPEAFCRNFAKFTGKHLCQSLFFNKVA